MHRHDVCVHSPKARLPRDGQLAWKIAAVERFLDACAAWPTLRAGALHRHHVAMSAGIF